MLSAGARTRTKRICSRGHSERRPSLPPKPPHPLGSTTKTTKNSSTTSPPNALQHEKEAAKQQEATFQKRAAETAPDLIASAQDVNGVPFLAVQIEDAPAAYLPVLADALKTRWQGVAVLATIDQGKVALLAAVAPAHAKKIQAGKIIQAIAPLVGGKGGGRPELAQGGGTKPRLLLASALAKAEEYVRPL